VNDFYLIWTYNTQEVTGYNSGWVNNPVYFPISYPGITTGVYSMTLQSSALSTGTMETVTNVSFYLDGDALDLQIVRDLWTVLGNVAVPSRPELSGGVEISFDNGNTFTRFDSNVGNKNLPETWIPLPASATSSGIAGQIGPYDIATMLVRWVIPPGATEYKLFQVGVNVDCDVI
jgi:hypothetical protein